MQKQVYFKVYNIFPKKLIDRSFQNTFFSDSHAVFQALDKPKISSELVKERVQTLTALGTCNIPKLSGYHKLVLNEAKI